jgi:tetratricopeptide (TPR) repeat protein
MIHKDVLMRQIQQMTEALAQALALISDGRTDEARHEIAQALDDLTDPGTLPLRERPVQDAVDHCTIDGTLATDLALQVADLLRHQGDLLRRQDRFDEALRCHVRALALYQTLLAKSNADTPLPLAIHDRMAHLNDAIDPERLHDDERAAVDWS